MISDSKKSPNPPANRNSGVLASPGRSCSRVCGRHALPSQTFAAMRRIVGASTNRMMSSARLMLMPSCH